MSPFRTPSRLLALCCLLGLPACAGSVNGDDAPVGKDDPAPGAGSATPGPKPTGPNGTTPVSGPAAAGGQAYPLLRLSVAQYENIVADVLGVTARFPDLQLDPSGTSTNEKDLLDGLYKAGALVAAKAFGPAGKFEKYCAAGEAAEACGRRFLGDVGPALFRRPLTTADGDRLLAVAKSAAELGTAQAMADMLTALLMSPSFTTVVETEGPGGRLRGEQIAARLSLLLWDTAPDADLLAAAAAGKLGDRAGVAEAAARMMASPKHDRFSQRFFDGWLNLPAVPGLQKAAGLDKVLTPEVAAALAAETRAFVRSVFGKEKSDFAELFTSPTSFVNRDVAKIYGLPGTFGAELVATDVSGGGKRIGLLSQPALMAALALPSEPSVAMRGVFVLRNIVCNPPNPPPANVPPLPDAEAARGKTLRERVAQHASSPVCAGCHRTIDGLGLGFENFDAVGRYQEKDAEGVAVTGAGTFYDLDDKAIAFRGAAELGKLVAKDRGARACFVSQLLERSLYRDVATVDPKSLQTLTDRFQSEGNMRRLVTDFVASDAFVTRKF